MGRTKGAAGPWKALKMTVPPGLHRRLKIVAVASDETMAGVVKRAVELEVGRMERSLDDEIRDVGTQVRCDAAAGAHLGTKGGE